MTRRLRPILNVALLFLIVLPVTSSCLLRWIGGDFRHSPEEIGQLSPGARSLVDAAFAGMDSERLLDYHAHLLGLGKGDTGIFVNPSMQSWKHPVRHLKFGIYLSAAGVNDTENADVEYVDRFVRLGRGIRGHGRYAILAFDRYHNADGSVNLEKTEFFVPNDYTVEIAKRHPDLFEPAISVHPYRADALEELERWGRQGVRMIKWLPNAMGIDPADPRNDAYYRVMKKYRMVLLTHTGEEQAVEAEEDQRLGNPLLLRRPLDQGVRVIMAHCASLGQCIDLDDATGRRVPCFSLFLRMMDDPRYKRLAFGDISAQFQFNRMPVPIATILRRQDLHDRLVNGSDYPLPAINVLLRTKDLVDDGFISADERKYLNEIYSYNPLLFDFVLKRTVHLPGSTRRLSPSIFMRNPGLM